MREARNRQAIRAVSQMGANITAGSGVGRAARECIGVSMRIQALLLAGAFTLVTSGVALAQPPPPPPPPPAATTARPATPAATAARPATPAAIQAPPKGPVAQAPARLPSTGTGGLLAQSDESPVSTGVLAGIIALLSASGAAILLRRRSA